MVQNIIPHASTAKKLSDHLALKEQQQPQVALAGVLITRQRPPKMAIPGVKASLTRCEEEVACLVSEGMTNEMISQKLAISEHKVRNYLYRVFEKLGLSSR